jgi:F-type H+-transporting ATPase subunit epsilon
MAPSGVKPFNRGTARTAYDEAEQRLNQVNPEDKQALIRPPRAVKRARAKLQAAEAVK